MVTLKSPSVSIIFCAHPGAQALLFILLVNMQTKGITLAVFLFLLQMIVVLFLSKAPYLQNEGIQISLYYLEIKSPNGISINASFN